MTQLNFMGMPCHPTDTYIDCMEVRREDKAKLLRKVYDKLVAIDPDGLEYLVTAAYEAGIKDGELIHDSTDY